MQQYLDSIRLSLLTKNYFSAIAMALTLPDICAAVDADNNETSGEKYCKWFNRYLADTYKQVFQGEKDKIIFGAPECYAARCSFLHQGTNIIKHQKRALKFATNQPALMINFASLKLGRYMRTRDILTLDVHFFCEDVISAVEVWMDDIKDDESKFSKIISMPIVHENLESMFAAYEATS